MLKRCKALLFAIILGLVCPSIIAGMVKRNIPDKIDINATTETIYAKKSSLEISVLGTDGTVNNMELNAYLSGVVLREMPAEFEFEALKAQAVVARTYALKRKESGGKHIEATVCMNPDCCQGYYSYSAYLEDGGKQEHVDVVKKAVDSTDGLVLAYEGELIDATYFSCSGGKTEDAKSVWGADIPYLRSTESPGEERAVHYIDTITFQTKTFLEKLGIDAKTITIGDISYTSGGGIETITVCGETFEGTLFRKLLGLRSTALVISVIADTVTITTKGFGHRVGMSQYGADAMAVNGADFTEILTHYYQGVNVVFYNDN